jgi:galactofuranose transport system permease protein
VTDTPVIDKVPPAEPAPGDPDPGSRRTPQRGLLGRALASPLVWPLLAVVVLVVLNLVNNPDFLDVRLQDGNLFGAPVNILRNATPVMLVAIGMTLVIATRGIDLSVGAIAAISATVSAVHIVNSPSEGATATAVTAIVMGLAVAVALGLWNGFLVSVLGIQPIIATLVLLVSGRGIAVLLSDGQIATPANDFFTSLRGGYVVALPVAVLIAFGVYALTALVVRRTALGMLVESVGINPEASRLAGVRARTITWTVYVFSALCAGFAGLLIAANTNSVNADNLGLWIELDAILAVVIGGTSLAGGRFSLTGTVIGAVLIALLTTSVSALEIPTQTNYLFKAVVVIAVCLLQSPRARAALRVRRSTSTRKAAIS